MKHRSTPPKLLLVLLPLLLAGSAQAEWLHLGRSDNFRIYLEQKLIQRNGDFVQIWQLMDFTNAQWADAQTPVGSIKSLIEYDCTAARSRTLAAEAFSEQMADGRMVAREQLPSPQWEGRRARRHQRKDTPAGLRQALIASQSTDA